MKLLTGNQIGSLIAYYRAKTLFDQGVLNKQNAARAVIIKTFVTTDLQKAIAEHYGLRCVETLTGFKYIGAKLGKYERALPRRLRQNYGDLTEEETRRLRLAHSSFYVFGGEESYGYSGARFRARQGRQRRRDHVLRSRGLREIARANGRRTCSTKSSRPSVISQEKNGSLTFEGAEGADKIKRLLESYATHPLTKCSGRRSTA